MLSWVWHMTHRLGSAQLQSAATRSGATGTESQRCGMTMLGRWDRRPWCRPVLDGGDDTEELLRVILGQLGQPLRGYQHALPSPPVLGVHAQVSYGPGLVVHEKILHVTDLAVFRLQGIAHDGGRRPETRLATLSGIASACWIDVSRLRVHVSAGLELRLRQRESKGTRVCVRAPQGLRRDKPPAIRKEAACVDHEIANSPAEVVEVQVMHATEFTVRRCDPHPPQVADTPKHAPSRWIDRRSEDECSTHRMRCAKSRCLEPWQERSRFQEISHGSRRLLGLAHPGVGDNVRSTT